MDGSFQKITVRLIFHPQDYENSNTLLFRDNSHFVSAFKNFENIRQSGKLCDVVIKVDNSKIYAHKIILSASIPYFQNMFLSGMYETNASEVTLLNMDIKSLQKCIDFAYSGEILITLNNVQSILIVANFLQMISLVNVCCRFIEERICIDSAVLLRRISKALSLISLTLVCDQFICENFETFCNSESFLKISFSELFYFIRSDDIKVSSEEFIFRSVMRWLEYQEVNIIDSEQAEDGLQSRKSEVDRINFIEPLMNQIRFTFLSGEFLTKIFNEFPILRSNIHTRDLVDHAKNFLIFPETLSKNSTKTFSMHPRKSIDVYGYIYALGGLNYTGDMDTVMERYHPGLNRWEIVGNLPQPRTRIGFTQLNGCLYAIGGYDGKNRLNNVDMFNPETGLWSAKAPLLVARSAGSAWSVNDRIFYCGGYNGILSMKKCEMYIPEKNYWVEIPDMIEARSTLGLVHLNDRLYVIGGHNGRQISNSVESLPLRFLNYEEKLKTNKIEWKSMCPMKTKRCRISVAVCQNRIIVAGGFDGLYYLDVVEMYTPDINDIGQWTVITRLMRPRARASLAVTNGALYIIGGFDGIQNVKTVHIFRSKYSGFTGRTPIVNTEINNAELQREKRENFKISFDSYESISNLQEGQMSINDETPQVDSIQATLDLSPVKNLGLENENLKNPFKDWVWSEGADLKKNYGCVSVAVLSITGDQNYERTTICDSELKFDGFQ